MSQNALDVISDIAITCADYALRGDVDAQGRDWLREVTHMLNKQRVEKQRMLSEIEAGLRAAGLWPENDKPTITFTDPSRADLAIDALADAGLTEEADQLREQRRGGK